MFRYLFALFVVIPVIEVWLLVTVGQQIGALPLVALILGTAFLGVRFLRQQGLSTLARAQAQMDAGQLPATELAEGVLLIVAGAFLLTPGFATDAVGFLLLWGQVRRWAATVCAGLMVRHGNFAVYSSHTSYRAGGFDREPGQGETFEGDFSREAGDQEGSDRLIERDSGRD